MQHDDPIREQALDWAVRAGDPDFLDWDDFTAWLERDPAHGEAYDRVSAALADATEAQKTLPRAANDDAAEPQPFLRRWAFTAVAAMLLVTVTLGLWQGQSGLHTIETAPGETRMIALADGGTIQLAGDSRLALDEANPRFAALEHGRALFTIIHDEGNPFVLDAGADRLVDAGTVFDVHLRDAELAVGVSEGMVIFNPDAQRVQIRPGQLLESPFGSDNVLLREIALEQVGEWGEGRLTFEQASIAEVAADLSSMTGIAFSAAPGSAHGEVSGSLLIDPIRAEPASLGPLLGVEVRAAGDGWLIGLR